MFALLLIKTIGAKKRGELEVGGFWGGSVGMNFFLLPRAFLALRSRTLFNLKQQSKALCDLLGGYFVFRRGLMPKVGG
jgi:hypothetical protein